MAGAQAFAQAAAGGIQVVPPGQALQHSAQFVGRKGFDETIAAAETKRFDGELRRGGGSHPNDSDVPKQERPVSAQAGKSLKTRDLLGHSHF